MVAIVADADSATGSAVSVADSRDFVSAGLDHLQRLVEGDPDLVVAGSRQEDAEFAAATGRAEGAGVSAADRTRHWPDCLAVWLAAGIERNSTIAIVASTLDGRLSALCSLLAHEATLCSPAALASAPGTWYRSISRGGRRQGSDFACDSPASKLAGSSLDPAADPQFECICGLPLPGARCKVSSCRTTCHS